jgi:hypothetical protein
MEIKKIMSWFLKVMHLILGTFLVWGAFISKKYLIYFLFLLPVIYLHWLTNNNNCVLTELELCLDSNPNCINNGENFEILGYILNYMNIDVPHKPDRQIIFCAVVSFFWVVGLYRYYK